MIFWKSWKGSGYSKNKCLPTGKTIDRNESECSVYRNCFNLSDTLMYLYAICQMQHHRAQICGLQPIRI